LIGYREGGDMKNEKYGTLVEELKNMIDKTLKLIVISLSQITTPEEWSETKDVMITEIYVPITVKDKLKQMSDVIVENHMNADINVDGMTIERLLFSSLIRKGLQATVVELIDSGEYAKLCSEIIKERQCGIQ